MGTNSKAGHQSYMVAPTLPPPTEIAKAPEATESVVEHDASDSVEPGMELTDELTDSLSQQGVDAVGLSGVGGREEREALTPVPDVVPEGIAVGTPILVGGEDLIDSTSTLMAYRDPAGGPPREVLLATVREEAEQKLMVALAVSEEKMVAVQVTEDVHGRLPRDEQDQVAERVIKAAKSVNHKISQGVAIPDHTWGYYEAADQAIAAIENDPDATDDEKAMAAHYRSHLDTIKNRLDLAKDGMSIDKVPIVGFYETHGTATITKMVPAPLDEPPPGLLPASLRTASRIQPSIDADTGESSWDGVSRSQAHGKEYRVDLGDGYTAIYRPYAANDPATHEFSIRGQLEVHAPHGGSNGHEQVSRLGQLHLANAPMTPAEGEWTYLEANVRAQGLADHPQVSDAVAKARTLRDLQVEELWYERAHEAAGMNQEQLHEFSRSLILEAETTVLPKKTKLLRDAMAKLHGYSDGDALAATAGYDPTPRRSGGWLAWTRFDVTTATSPSWSNRSLVHKVNGGGLANMLATGVLASTERRALMGIPAGMGKSEHADKLSGGANSVFLRVYGTAPSSGPALIWDDPSVLFARADYYGYNSDHYGALNPQSNQSTKGMVRDPSKIAGFTSSSNEVCFRTGIDLLGAEAPSRILCGNIDERDKVRAGLKKRGITHIGSRPIDDVVQT